MDKFNFTMKLNSPNINRPVIVEDILDYKQLKKLSAYKNITEGKSMLEYYLLPLWRAMSSKLPNTSSAIFLAISGLIANIIATVVLICFSPSANSYVPSWIFSGCSMGLLSYHVLSMMGLKQIKQMDTSQPLINFVDCGCDAISIVFLEIGVCITIRLGTHSAIMLLHFFISLSIYYMAYWQAYCTGTLQITLFSLIELQCIAIMAFLITLVTQFSIWDFQILSMATPVKVCTIIFGTLVGIFSSKDNFESIFIKGGIGRNGSTIAGTSVLSPGIPLIILYYLCFLFWENSVTGVVHRHSQLFMIMSGIVVSKFCLKITLMEMTCSEMPLLDTALLGPFIIVLLQYFALFSDYILLWFAFHIIRLI